MRYSHPSMRHKNKHRRTTINPIAAPALGCLLALLAVPAWALDINVRGGMHDDFNRLVFDWPRAPAYKLLRDADRIAITFAGPATGFKLDASARKLTRLNGFAVAQQADATQVSFTVAPQAMVKDFLSGTSLVIDVRGAAVGQLAGNAPPSPEPADTAADSAAALALQAPSVPASAKTAGVTAVLFERGGQSYALTDDRRKAVTDMAKPLAVTGGGSGWMQATGGQPAEVLTFTTDDHDRLHVTAAAPNPTLQKPASVVAQADATGGHIAIPLQVSGTVLSFTDPVTGEPLYAVTSDTATYMEAHSYRDFELLPTRQGIVVRPLNDKLAVRAGKAGVEIAAPGGLALSPQTFASAAAAEVTPVAAAPDQSAPAAPDGQRAPEAAAATPATPGLFLPITENQPRQGESFTAARQRLQTAAAAAPDDVRAVARLNLARFYLANAYGQEASGVLKDIAADAADMASRPEFRALRGMTAVLRGDSDGLAMANAALALPELSQYPDLPLWQAVGLAKQHNYTAAAPLFSQSLTTLADYPEPFFTDFSTLAAESLLAANDNKGAAAIVQLVEQRGGTAAIGTPAMQYIRGVLESRIGSLDQAKQLWQAAAEGQDMLARTRARLALIDLGLAAKTIAPSEAAQQLEGLRYGWRGDSLELEILQRLASAYAAADQPDEALNALERAKRIQGDRDSLAAIDKQERQIFADLFTGPKIDKYPPLKALATYNRYKQFVPTDPQVAQAINAKLVDKMLSIDLLGQAADLLEQRLPTLTDTAEKAKLGARVAGVRLLNGEAPQALKDLDVSEAPNNQGGLAADVAEERKLLRARALAEASGYGTQGGTQAGPNGQTSVAPALALLKDDTSADARRLDATIAWRARDWVEAARALGSLVPQPAALPPQKPEGRLTDEQAQYVMRRAVALTLASDTAGIAQLATDYGPAMQQTALADSFTLMTAPEGAVKGIATLPAELKDVDLFRTFLEGYRK